MEDINSNQILVELEVADRGPLRIKGLVKLTTPDGNVRIMERCSVCRCGESKCQPFCDGSHKQKSYNQQHETFF